MRGHQRPEAADPDKIRELARWGAQGTWRPASAPWPSMGRPTRWTATQNAGGLPTRNFQSGSFEGYEKIDGRTMYETILKERDTCFACAVRCKRVVEIKEGPFQVDPLYGGPEYETLATLGSLLRRRRPGRRLQGQRVLQQVRPGHHLLRRDRRLGDGVLRARRDLAGRDGRH